MFPASISLCVGSSWHLHSQPNFFVAVVVAVDPILHPETWVIA